MAWDWVVIEAGGDDDDDDSRPKHFAVWCAETGAVAGRFYERDAAEEYCAEVRGGAVVDYNPHPIAGR
jgi:hypothetical protein